MQTRRTFGNKGWRESVAENQRHDDRPPEWFVNTAVAPRGWGFATSAGLLVGGLVMTWAAASDPIFGLGLGHPATIALAGLVVCLAVGSAIYTWALPDERWRRVPDGPLSPEFRALADGGRELEAMDRLRQEHGAGVCEARQVLAKYLGERPRGQLERSRMRAI